MERKITNLALCCPKNKKIPVLETTLHDFLEREALRALQVNVPLRENLSEVEMERDRMIFATVWACLHRVYELSETVRTVSYVSATW